MKTLLLPVLATFAATAPLLAQNGDRLARRVDSIFAQYDRAGSPGAAVVVVRKGRVLFEKGYGYANLEHGVRITPATVFDVASVSKQFAGLAIAMLVDQGRIRLEDDVRRYIPELHPFRDTIRIDHLVHHTSGIRDWPGGLGIAGWRLDDVIAFDQILRFAVSQKSLNFTPGAEYTYSNTGYNLLAEVVQRVTGTPFRAWTEENIFRPLGMTSTHFHDDHSMVVDGRAYGYGRSGGAFTAISNNLTALGSSSLYSSARDLAKWVTNFDDAKVGGARAMALTRTQGRLNSGAQIAYAFGISHGNHRGQPTLSHSGSWAGFSTFVLHLPQKRTGVIVLANTPMNTGAAAHTIASIFLEAELAAEPAPASSAASGPEVEVPGATLERYTGVYRLGPAWYVTIRREGNRLLTRATAEQEYPLSARSATSFWVAGYNAAMDFALDTATGAVSMLYRGRRIARLTEREPDVTPGARGDLAGIYVSDELATSYTVRVSGDSIALWHYRHGTIPLRRAWGDDYHATPFFLRSVAFQRDAAGRVTGFVVNAGERVRDVVFVKR